MTGLTLGLGSPAVYAACNNLSVKRRSRQHIYVLIVQITIIITNV